MADPIPKQNKPPEGNRMSNVLLLAVLSKYDRLKDPRKDVDDLVVLLCFGQCRETA